MWKPSAPLRRNASGKKREGRVAIPQARSAGGEELFPKLVCGSKLLKEFAVCGQDGGRIAAQRKFQAKFRPLPRRGLGLNLATVVMHDEVGRHEVDAVLARAVTARIERIENGPQRFLGKARPIVTDDNTHALTPGL